MKLKNQSYIRKGTYSIEETFAKIKPYLKVDQVGKGAKINFDGDMIYPNSQRYQTFYYTGTKCSCCGLEAKYFAKEKDSKSKLDLYHLNLYGIDENGKEVLFTKDHIFPYSKGGRNHISNYKTMCERCNCRKGVDTKCLSFKDRIRINIIKTDIGKKLVTNYIVKHPVYHGS